jgi:isoaspartyl peptidase/L-asparaginase-like protein (Ntn-hydrolase superfamily)
LETYGRANRRQVDIVRSAGVNHRVLEQLSRRDFLGSENGLRAVTRAMELMENGSDTLDAAVEGVKIQELDPPDNPVGYGGLPHEDGVR